MQPKERSSSAQPLRTPSGVSGGITRSSSLTKPRDIPSCKYYNMGSSGLVTEPVNLKRPHRVCSALTATFQLARLVQIVNAEGTFCSLRPTGRSGTTEEGFCVPWRSVLALMVSEGFLPVNLVTSRSERLQR